MNTVKFPIPETKAAHSQSSDETGSFKNIQWRGAWVARWVKRPTLGFGSGRDHTLRGFKPHVRLCAGSSALDSVSLSLPLFPPPPMCAHSLSLNINK